MPVGPGNEIKILGARGRPRPAQLSLSLLSSDNLQPDQLDGSLAVTELVELAAATGIGCVRITGAVTELAGTADAEAAIPTVFRTIRNVFNAKATEPGKSNNSATLRNGPKR